MDTAKAEDWDLPRERAVPRLLEQHGSRLFGLSSRICGNREDAEDLVQEVFLQAFRNWDQFERRSDPVVWLYTIARHACQRMHRKRAGEPDHLDSLDELLPFGEPRIAVIPAEEEGIDVVVRHDQQERVGVAIAALPVDFRMPLILKDIIGFKIEEVASILGINPATVKTRLHRARLRVRHELATMLPARELPPPAYSRQVCLDLLQAKQESLDRGIEMPNADNIICERCQAVFATMDLSTGLCRSLRDREEMPESLRRLLHEAMQAGRHKQQ